MLTLDYIRIIEGVNKMEMVILTVLLVMLGIVMPITQLLIESRQHPRGWLRRKFGIYTNYFGLGI